MFYPKEGMFKMCSIDDLPDDIIELCLTATKSEVAVRACAQLNWRFYHCAKRVLSEQAALFPPTRLALRYVGYCRPSARSRPRVRQVNFQLGQYYFNLILSRTILPVLKVGLQMDCHLQEFSRIQGKVYLESHDGLTRDRQDFGPVLFTSHNDVHIVTFELEGYRAEEDLYIIVIYLELLLEGSDYVDYLCHRPPQSRAKMILIG